MKVNIYSVDGKTKTKIDLPKIFESPFRPDLIKRSVLSLQSAKRQPYGADVMAGMRTAAHYHGKRRYRYSMMNKNKARMPRLHGGAPHMTFRAREVPQTVKGRRSHPPKVEKVWKLKINNRENIVALKSAIAATADKILVQNRGHRVSGINELPIVLEDNVQEIKKTKDFEKLLLSLGLKDELKRCQIKKEKPGRGKLRGRRYKKKIGPLVVVTDDKGISKAAVNIPGVNVIRVDDLNTEILAPGADAGRLTIWSQSAMEKLKVF
ncbi:MAG: 50S ribosomal protein L4 [Candidatus Aenigmarchaeota archaeon]|nr:50S ribosomal protein L4 [Candidatus Aenigmarchaeota archaeon]